VPAQEVGNASFEDVQKVLIEFRDATGYENWKETKKVGWDKLETCTTMEELGQCDGVKVRRRKGEDGADGEYEVQELFARARNLVGAVPASLAKLDTLMGLYLDDNSLEGSLPCFIGSKYCLPNLKRLVVRGNKDLGGDVSATFLASCEGYDGTGSCVRTPYLTGCSLSSEDIVRILSYAPNALVSGDKVEGHVAEIDSSHPKFSAFTSHLPRALKAKKRSWRTWQATWLEDLRRLEGAANTTSKKTMDESNGSYPTGANGRVVVGRRAEGYGAGCGAGFPPGESPKERASSPTTRRSTVYLVVFVTYAFEETFLGCKYEEEGGGTNAVGVQSPCKWCSCSMFVIHLSVFHHQLASVIR
jgi:hypothetical protein